MKILVTGAKGFVGRNLCHMLKSIRDGKARNYSVTIDEVMEFDLGDEDNLEDYCQRADFVFNLAGVNRPKDETEFMKGNFGFASILLDTLQKHHNTCPVMISSSTQAALDNPYGKSKLAGENLMREYSQKTGAKTLIYRFPNLFGKWCRPNYNSAVATFCNNIANDLPIIVNNRETQLTLVYVDDLVEEMIRALQGKENNINGICQVPPSHDVTLGEIVDMLYRFNNMHENLEIPDLQGFEKKLYSTYLSYLPAEKTIYDLKMNCDARGSFTEILHLANKGQVSVNISKPGITKGEHWHNTKNEKFIIVSGEGLIRLRKLDENNIREYHVSGDKMQVVEMLPGYTHSIVNLSNSQDLVTLMWCNERFDPMHPDTFHEEV